MCMWIAESANVPIIKSASFIRQKLLDLKQQSIASDASREAYLGLRISPVTRALQIVVQQACAHYREMRRVHISSVSRTAWKPIFSQTQNRCEILARTRKFQFRDRRAWVMQRIIAANSHTSSCLSERFKFPRDIVVFVPEDKRATENMLSLVHRVHIDFNSVGKQSRVSQYFAGCLCSGTRKWRDRNVRWNELKLGWKFHITDPRPDSIIGIRRKVRRWTGEVNCLACRPLSRLIKY